MDLLERLLGHDEWTTRQLMIRCRELSEIELHQTVDAGHESVHRTLVHMIENVRTWTDLMEAAGSTNAGESWEERSLEQLSKLHERAYADFAALARRIQDEARLDELWLDRLDDPPAWKSYGGAIAHVFTHNMHHRSELLHILSRLGLKELPEGDLLGWEATKTSYPNG